MVARIILVLIAASLALILSACGSEGGPSVHILLEADLSDLPAEADHDQVMTSLMDTLERRAIAFGTVDSRIQREDPNRVSVVLRGVISQEEARELLERDTLLDFRQPVLDEDGRIICQQTDGARFSISTDEITYTPEHPAARAVPRCLDSAGKSGHIVWEPVEVNDGEGLTEDEITTTLQPVSAVADRIPTPAVIASLSPDGTDLFQQITTRLVGLPLGIVVSGELLAGPTVRAPVTNGEVIITNLSLSAAYILAAQLTTGPLPVSVKEISVEAIAK